MAENLPNLKMEIDIQVQETQRVPNKMNPNRSTPKDIIFKMTKLKENFKGSKRKRVTYKEPP